MIANTSSIDNNEYRLISDTGRKAKTGHEVKERQRGERVRVNEWMTSRGQSKGAEIKKRRG